MNWYIKALKQYADFEGRARRTEYWMFILFYIIFAIVAMIIDGLLGFSMAEGGFSPIQALYSLAMIVPAIAVSVRSLHDVGKSGWMLLVGLIPFIGYIWLLVLYVTDSNPGTNQYGSNPKE